MEDVHSAGKIPYEKAAPQPSPTIIETLSLYTAVAFDVAKVLLLSLLELIIWILTIWLPSSKKNISGQTVLVTGGGNGLGREIALQLSREGCNIAIVDVDSVGAEQTSMDCRELGTMARFYICDVSDNEGVQKMIKAVEDDFGPIEILINNAGLMPLNSFREGKPEDIKKVYDVNVFSHFWMTRAVIDKMIDRGRGHIVAISSISALHAMPGAIIYSSTKYAVTGFMRALSEEVRQDGFSEYVKFTCVYPYFIPTRKDLTEAANLRFPAVSVEYVTRQIVKAIRTNKSDVVIPWFTGPLIRFINMFPRFVQNLVRDRVTRERESRMFKTKDEKYNMKKD